MGMSKETHLFLALEFDTVPNEKYVHITYNCPSCDKNVDKHVNYCETCGDKILWKKNVTIEPIRNFLDFLDDVRPIGNNEYWIDAFIEFKENDRRYFVPNYGNYIYDSDYESLEIEDSFKKKMITSFISEYNKFYQILIDNYPFKFKLLLKKGEWNI